MPSASGSTSGAAITNLAEFKAAIARMGSLWDAEFSLLNQKIASKAASGARGRAGTGTPLQAKAASAIGERHSKDRAAVAVLPSALDRMANVAFYGAKRHFGWYGRSRYNDSTTPQAPPWVGNTWDVAVAGQGPYAINNSLAAHLREYQDEWLDGVRGMARRAFPD